MGSINYKNYPILLVDDDMSSIAPIRHRLEKVFQVDAATSGKEALEKLKMKNYAVILSDQKMEPMDGIELLSRSSREYPDTVRILITGYPDYAASVDATNKAKIYQYVFKSPNIATDIVYVVFQAVDHYWEREERLRLQKMLMRENRLSAIGRLSHALAHEMNNPLSVISNFTQMLPEKYDNPEYRKGFFEHVPESLKRIQAIVSRMSSLTGEEERIEKNPINLHDLIKEASDLFTKDPEAKKIKILKRCENTNPHIKGNPSQLIQVLLNLFTNSAQAVKEGDKGKVEIMTEKDSIILKDREGKESPYIRLIVKDNGPGMDEKILKNIFDPLVSTHITGSTNRRPGLGLFISQLIIEGHHGYIDLQSKVGEGTTVVIELPIFMESSHL
ncbi:MAG: response regulator [Chlamydiae bacterium]|nr:response regulator [Chlamydiota bacterium]MBI3265645.1 response regulator [Chlamydiota bacterium]